MLIKIGQEKSRGVISLVSITQTQPEYFTFFTQYYIKMILPYYYLIFKK